MDADFILWVSFINARKDARISYDKKAVALREAET